MKNVLIISATSKSNYNLSKDIGGICEKLGASVNIISLEDYMLPLYTDQVYKQNKNDYANTIREISNFLLHSKGIVICGPEYNGSIHPIITNMITWISVSTENWRDAFSNKISLIGTSSGGMANRFTISMRTQLEHLGSVVMPRTINVSKSNPLNKESANKILKQFVELL